MNKLIRIIPIAALIILMASSVANALCIDATEANLRYGPGTRYKRTLEGYKYMPVRKIGQKGSWLRIKDQDGDIHWIHRKLVTSKYKCAAVKGKEANIRNGPGTNHKVILYSPALKYYSFKVVQIKNKWVHIEDDLGDRGWIYRPLLWIQ